MYVSLHDHDLLVKSINVIPQRHTKHHQFPTKFGPLLLIIRNKIFKLICLLANTSIIIVTNNAHYCMYMYQGCRKQRKANILRTDLVRQGPRCIPMIINIRDCPLWWLFPITFPSPASCSNLNALTAPSLFPISQKRLAFNRALRWRVFPRRRQYASRVVLLWWTAIHMCRSWCNYFST